MWMAIPNGSFAHTIGWFLAFCSAAPARACCFDFGYWARAPVPIVTGAHGRQLRLGSRPVLWGGSQPV